MSLLCLENYDELVKFENKYGEDAKKTNPHSTLNITQNIDGNTTLVSNNGMHIIDILTLLIHTFHCL